MDRLTPETLKAIAESIKQDPRVFRRQATLAALARTNKTLYSICNPLLYQRPALADAKMAMKWGEFYSTKVNPWIICKGTKSFEDVVVPLSIRFKRRKEKKTKQNDQARAIFPRLEGPVDGAHMTRLAFSSYFFRNLTSFIVDNNYSIEPEFVSALFGPIGSKRRSIKQLALLGSRQSLLVSFLLEAVKRMSWEWKDSSSFSQIVELLPDAEIDEETRDLIERTMEEEEDLEDLEDEVYEKLASIALRFASVNFAIFRKMQPSITQAVSVLLPILESRDVPCHPFGSLRNLSLSIEQTFETYLILYSGLFPALRHLKIKGSIQYTPNTLHDVKLFRLSITRRKGRILPPRIEPEVLAAFNSQFSSWNWLTKKEQREGPEISYYGPRLRELDLSESSIVA
ncbi:hypothetical protein JCM3765_004296 [Sporobolomyces pararoseus]